MSNIAKIQAAAKEAEARGYPVKNLLLSKVASTSLVREISGRDVDVTLSTVCGLDIFVTDTLPDRIGILRYLKEGRPPFSYAWAEPVIIVEFDL